MPPIDEDASILEDGIILDEGDNQADEVGTIELLAMVLAEETDHELLHDAEDDADGGEAVELLRAEEAAVELDCTEDPGEDTALDAACELELATVEEPEDGGMLEDAMTADETEALDDPAILDTTELIAAEELSDGSMLEDATADDDGEALLDGVMLDTAELATAEEL